VARGPIRVVVVADRDVVAARLEATLRGDPDLCVWLGPPSALGRLVEEHDPAVVVLASTAARATATLGALAETTRVLPVVLVVDDPRAAWTPATRRAGVRAVLDRDAGREAIVAAIAAVLAGLVTLHPDVVRAAPRAARTGLDDDEDRALTPRELEILEMLAEGLSNQAIARRLHISRYTVKFHVASVLDKLGAASRTEAVTLGVRRGLIAL